VHGYTLLALPAHRQDAVELLDVLTLLTDGGQVRHEYVLQLLANDLVLLSNAEISLMPQWQTIPGPTTHVPTYQPHVEQPLGGTVGLRQRSYEIHLAAGHIKVENQMRGCAVGTKIAN